MSASGHEEAEAHAGVPLLIRRAERAPWGALLLTIAAMWLAVAVDGLLNGQPAVVPGLDRSGAYLAGAIGAALAVIALDWLVRGRIVVISRDTVAVTVWWLLGRQTRRQPLADFREVRVDREQRLHRHAPRTWYVVRLCHAEPNETIELARAKDPALIGRRARAYAKRCGLPLIWNVDETTVSDALTEDGGIAAARAAGMPLSSAG